MGHETLRRKMRRQIQFRLKQREDLNRRAPTPQEAKGLFESIDHNKTSDFGIVKLAQFNLDLLYPVPEYKREHGGSLQSWARGITFVAYAAHRGNDAALASLLRAGADASVRLSRLNNLKEEGEEETFAAAAVPLVPEYLSHIPAPFAAWLVKRVVNMRRLAGLASSKGAALTCQVCNSSALPLMWPECEHSLCEPCLWRLQQESDLAIACPCCSTSSTPDDDSNSNTVWYSAESAQARKEESFNKWSQLPACKEDLDRKQKKEVFRALDRAASAAATPGRTRPQRMEQFLKAAEEDDVFRIEALVELGVDVDGINECGETALLVAGWLGHAAVARALLCAGADPRKLAHGGYTAISIARTHHHEDVVAVFAEAGFTEAGNISYPFEYCEADDCIMAQPCCIHGPSKRTVTELLPKDLPHPGAGSLYVDGVFDDAFLERLEALWETIPQAPSLKMNSRSYADTCAIRSFFCDAEGWVSAHLGPLASELLGTEVSVLPRMRFLFYGVEGGDMQPHTDLAKKNLAGVSSTHTFMLHLADCEEGGETVYLEKLPPIRGPMTILARAQPKRGRLILFPHVCPHAGLPVINHPPRKLFVRGELLCGSGNVETE